MFLSKHERVVCCACFSKIYSAVQHEGLGVKFYSPELLQSFDLCDLSLAYGEQRHRPHTLHLYQSYDGPNPSLNLSNRVKTEDKDYILYVCCHEYKKQRSCRIL